MNSEFQVIRWGIPGWIFFMTVLIFKLSVVGYDLMSIVNKFTNPAAVAGLAAFTVGLGVPLGYILYQVYYGFKWRIMKTKTVLIATQDIPELPMLLSNKNGLELWHSIEGHFDTLMTIHTYGKKISYKDLTRRYNSFSNRTSRIHGLGASVVAMVTGFILFFITTENRASFLDNNLFLLTFASYLICLFAVIINYRKQNKFTFVQLNQIMRDIINAEDKKNKNNKAEKNDNEDEGEEEEEEEGEKSS
ncbi:hypothetical protein [Peribacillus sp. NPDC058075]|uniref:hypothetical protein n=1 Tax=unclassified Peribacillus TaxID=2675266 RepID=UPI0036D86FE5